MGLNDKSGLRIFEDYRILMHPSAGLFPEVTCGGEPETKASKTCCAIAAVATVIPAPARIQNRGCSTLRPYAKQGTFFNTALRGDDIIDDGIIKRTSGAGS